MMPDLLIKLLILAAFLVFGAIGCFFGGGKCPEE